MFKLFEFERSRSKSSVVGIDLGTTYIKVVELDLVNREPTLVNYGQAELGFSEGKGVFQIQAPEEKVRVHLRALLRKMKITEASVCLSLPAASGLLTVIEMPSMSDKELESAIRFEAPKYIPIPIEEVVLSWEVIRPSRNPNEKMQILLVAALDKDIARYESYLHGQPLSLEVLELEIFSLVRSSVDDMSKNWMLIDIGSRITNMILVGHGAVVAHRTLSFGGNEITNTLMESLRVSWARAEQLKKGTNDYFHQQGAPLVFPSLEMVRYEAKRLIETAQKQNQSLDGVILSGGSVRMKGLDQYISDALQLPVTFANPWARVRFPEQLRPAIERYGSSFSIAIGLALGGLEQK